MQIFAGLEPMPVYLDVEGLPGEGPSVQDAFGPRGPCAVHVLHQHLGVISVEAPLVHWTHRVLSQWQAHNAVQRNAPWHTSANAENLHPNEWLFIT